MVADEKAIYFLEKVGESTKVSKIDTKSGVVESIFGFEDNFHAICLVGNGNLLVLSTKRLMFIDVKKLDTIEISTGLDISVKLSCVFVLKHTIYLGGISKEDDTFEEMVWTKIQNESVVSLESNKPSLELNLKQIILSKPIEFVVENGEGGEGGHYYANKGILAKSGSYFEVLFSPENQRFVENQTSRIVVKDTTNSAMEALVWYIYGDPTKITVSNVVNVLRLADRWNINNLEVRVLLPISTV